jgi:hypothetical protein
MDALTAHPETARTARFYSDTLLTILLTDFQIYFPAFILLSRATIPAPESVRHEDPDDAEAPSLPYISKHLRLDRSFLSFVPMHGPNNQLAMTYEAAALAWGMNVRGLLPPTSPHYVKNDRPGVPQEAGRILPADRIFTAHFIHRSALLADPASSWEGLLPALDFVLFEPLPRAACPAPGNCTVGELMAAHGYIRRHFRATGLSREENATLNIIRCDTAAQPALACLESALAAGGAGAAGRRRGVIAFWDSISEMGRALRIPCGHRRAFGRAAPFALQGGMLDPANAPGRACLALQLRLRDSRCRGGGGRCSVNGVPEARLGGAPAFDVLMRPPARETAAWRGRTLLEVVALVRDAAARRGLGLYVLMPFHRALFDAAARLGGVRTARSLAVAGRSDLEVLFLDMALAAGCDGGVVQDPRSSLSVTIAAMRGWEGALTAALEPTRSRGDCGPGP